VAKRAFRESSADNVPMRAGGVAFFAFLAVFPALIARSPPCCGSPAAWGSASTSTSSVTTNQTYGTLAGVIVLMLWLYLTGYIVLLVPRSTPSRNARPRVTHPW